MSHRPHAAVSPRTPLADVALHVMLGLGRSTQRWLRKLERAQAAAAGSASGPSSKRH